MLAGVIYRYEIFKKSYVRKYYIVFFLYETLETKNLNDTDIDLIKQLILITRPNHSKYKSM